MNLTEAELIIIQNLSNTGGTGNIMEFLNYTVSDFDRGFTIANEMQNKDLVKLLYSNFNKNMVVVEITLVGFNAAKSGK